MNAATLSRSIAIMSFIGGLGGGLVFPILPVLGLQLGLSGFMVGLILSANRITRLVFNLPAGHLIGRAGPRAILSGALLLEAVGVLCFVAALRIGPPAAWLLGGRILFGIGTSFLMVGAQAAVLSLAAPGERGRRSSVVRLAISLAMPCGLILGGILADLYGDQAAFLAGTGITLLGAIYAWRALPPMTPRSEGAPPRPGFVAGLRLLRGSPNFRIVAAACGFNMLIFLTMQGALLATMVVLVGQRDITMFGFQAQGTSGLVMAVLIGCSAMVSLRIGRLIDAVPLRAAMIVPALVGLAAGFAILALAQTLWLVLLGAVCVGLSYNGVTLPMLALLGDAVDEGEHGPAVGLYQFFGDIGGSLGPLIGIEVATRIGAAPLYLGLAVLPLLAVVAALRLIAAERSMRGSAEAAAEQAEDRPGAPALRQG